ncbi:hypothetical protein [Geothermobacter hydrogeniphilus]|uniref:O-Antigen ligase n=1 Tax=Geothermobacter hydrogeniphilus TaxID=1969733 RepID=A0A1X0Y0Q3_9BACT|nr:hypothetical protein [Geothermobacter hydrogeniphilus]ORJ58775.1 hypothetical protein B5V00_11815 [Geothermobacter hydrogeniphilus]
MSISVAPALLHAFFVFQFLTVFAGVSATAAKFALGLLAFVLMFVSTIQKRKYVKWHAKDLHANGFLFFLWYAVALMMGLMYGFDAKYVLINVLSLAPIFAFLFIPERVDVEKILNIVVSYSFCSAILGIIEVYLWQDVPFVKHYVDVSLVMKDVHTLNSNLFRDGSLKAFGMFNNALQNGIFMVLGVGIILFRICGHRKKIYWLMLLIYLPAIYFTYTRNVYFTLAAIILFFAVVTMSNKKTLSWLWFFCLGLYAGVMSYSVYHALGIGSFDGDSIMARVISWGIIINDYLLSEKSLLHIVFGYGITQLSGSYAPPTSFWAIDNSLLLVFLGSGLAGVCLFLAWVIHASSYLNKKLGVLRSEKEIRNHHVILVFLFVYLLSGAMNANVFNTQVLLPMVMLLSACFRFGVRKRNFQ